MTAKRKWTAADVVHAIRHAYGLDAEYALGQEEWSLVTEVALRAPTPRQYAAHKNTDDYWSSNVRTIDILLTRNWGSGAGFRRVAVEVKVSKSDYRNETDLKRAPAEAAAHHTYYAAPAGIIDPETLPWGWGLIEIHPDAESYDGAKGWALGDTWRDLDYAIGRCKVRRRPVDRTPAPTDYLVAAGMRRASRLAERLRRGEDDAAQVETLRADVERLTAQLERRDSALHRERDKVRQVKTALLAAAGEQVCSECREPIGYNLGRGLWTHRVAAQEKVCSEARSEADRLGKEARFQSRYMRGWAAPVTPLAAVEQSEGLPDPVYD